MRLILLTIISAALMAAQEKTMSVKSVSVKSVSVKSVSVKSMTVKRLTPNLYTDDVESCVKFWVERMHFDKTMEVPDGGRLAFSALQKGSIELMYGTYASLEKDPGVAGSYQRGTGFLFIEVDDLDAVLAAMKGVPTVAPAHTTFYGSTEFTVKDPAGHLITFAHFAKQ